MAYNVNPKPQSGSGPFGSVPGPVSLPQPYQAFGQVFPGTQAIQTKGASDVLNQLDGQLSPETLASIQNEGAAWGVESGMGTGSGVQNNRNLYTAAMDSMNEQNQGAQQYGNLVGNSSKYLTVAPSTEAQIAEFNAVNAAAPNPTLAGLTNIGAHVAGLGFGYGINQLNGGQSTGMGANEMTNPTFDQTGFLEDPSLGGTDLGGESFGGGIDAGALA